MFLVSDDIQKRMYRIGEIYKDEESIGHGKSLAFILKNNTN